MKFNRTPSRQQELITVFSYSPLLLFFYALNANLPTKLTYSVVPFPALTIARHHTPERAGLIYSSLTRKRRRASCLAWMSRQHPTTAATTLQNYTAKASCPRRSTYPQSAPRSVVFAGSVHLAVRLPSLRAGFALTHCVSLTGKLARKYF
jgi:hypothetical protein